MTSRRVHRGFVFVLFLAVAGAGAFHLAGRVPALAAGEKSAGVSPETLATIDAISSAFRQVARQVKPAVVQIEVKVIPDRTSGRSSGLDLRDLPAPFREYFKDLEGRQIEPQPQVGRGSGTIIDAENGYILTNNHVVGGDADKERVRIDVTLADGRSAHADVVGRDPKTDVALVKIQDSDLARLKKEFGELPALTIGDSDAMEVGDWVLAVGAPFNLAQSVTQGIISAKGRGGVGVADIEDFLQTDAAINPGNSGGPLVNMRGELIGVNTAIATSSLTRGYMGIGFAIPSVMIKEMLPRLKEGREVVRGYLGAFIRGLETQPGAAKTFGLKEDRGVLIEDLVDSDSPASKAGLKSQDVILAYGDTKIETRSQLQELVARTEPGTKVDLKVWRDGKEITIPLTVGKQPDDFSTFALRGQPGRSGPRSEEEAAETTIKVLGMKVTRLTEDLAEKYGWEYDEYKGMVVATEVEPLGEAAALRIEPGDLIVSVQGKPIKSGRDLQKALSDEALAEGVRLQIRSSRLGLHTVFLQIGS